MTSTSTSIRKPRQWHYIEIIDNGSNGTIILEKETGYRLATVSLDGVPNIAVPLPELSDPAFVELIQYLPLLPTPIVVDTLDPFKPHSPFHSERLYEYIKYLKDLLAATAFYLVYVNVDEIEDVEKLIQTGAKATLELTRKDTIT